ncbi:N(4)-(beta-N-acetylglucosaminyl)-L-asparaginase [Novosphingobium sp. ZW T3_23]|uniref:N(4)-(beta-N-acetylglucosaminyl)-L-asparaginase n=1 Tax=Novosphingobium sp. ZW T3_23 TaxID=3378084 RepID=UPI003853C71D
MGISRRDTLGFALAGAAAAGTARAAPAAAKSTGTAALIVSTWDFGTAANAAAYSRLKAGGTLIDAVEAGAQVPEKDLSNHSVGMGGYPDRDGHVTLDAIIMDDRGHAGAVAALEGYVHAISVARRIMERTPHTMLVGDGAAQFAREQGFTTQNLLTPEAEAAWKEWLKKAEYKPVANIENQRGSALDHDTIGILARSPEGRLAGACTTSGMAFKLRGRVGDSPQAGCGLLVEPGVGAATATGVGEEVTRIAGAARVIGSMRMGLSAMAACREAVEHIVGLRGEAVKDAQVAFLAIDKDGQVGAFAIQPGFTYAVTDESGHTQVHPSQSLRRA